MGPRWPGSACKSFAFLMRSKLRVGAEVAGRAVMNCPVCKSDSSYSRQWKGPAPGKS
jgi:hypothetical protein